MSATLDDPQVDDDQTAARLRESVPEWGRGKPSALAEKFETWARGAAGTAVKRRACGDLYGARLADSRSSVYAQAASHYRDLGPVAIEIFHRNEVGNSTSDAGTPLGAEDRAGIQHACAMAWQLCAQAIDPSYDPVEKPW